jgi:hypothetical protein
VPRAPGKELQAEIGFQVADRRIQRLLRQVQPLSGTLEVQLLGETSK